MLSPQVASEGATLSQCGGPMGEVGS